MVRKIKIRMKTIALAAGLFSLLLVTVFSVCISGGSTTAHAHSGGTDASGGHFEHTAACRNSGYKNHTSACTYHYHSGSSSSSGISGGTSNNGSGGSGSQSSSYEIPKVSDEQMQAYLKSAIERLEAENNAMAKEQYGNTTNSSSDSGSEIAAIVVFSLIGVGLIVTWIYKKKTA